MLFGIDLNVSVEVTVLGMICVKFMEILLVLVVLVPEGSRVVVVELPMVWLCHRSGVRFIGFYQFHSSQFDLCCRFSG